MTVFLLNTRRVPKGIQAKDVPENDLLAFIGSVNATGRWASRRDVDEAFLQYPPKVLLSKCRSLLKRRLLNGCGCGCRGDFRIPAEVLG